MTDQTPSDARSDTRIDDRIDACLAAFGADLRRWPVEVATALGARGDGGALAGRVRDATWLDGALADWPVMQPDPRRIEALMAAVDALAPSSARPKAFERAPLRERLWLTGSAMLAVAASIVAVLLIAQPRETAPVALTDEAAVAMVFSTEQSEGWSQGWM